MAGNVNGPGNPLPAGNAFSPHGDLLAAIPAGPLPWQTALAATTPANARIKAAMASGPNAAIKAAMAYGVRPRFPLLPYQAVLNAMSPPSSISQLHPRPAPTAARANQFQPPSQFQPPNQFRYAARTSIPLPVNSFADAFNAFLNNASANVTYAPPGMDPNAGFQDNTRPPW